MMRIYELETLAPEEILNRDIRAEADVDAAVDAILEDVRLHGDGALRRYTRELDGAELAFGWQPVEINDDGPVFKKILFDEEGNQTGIDPTPVQVQADSVLISISQGPKSKLVNTTEGLKASENGLLVTNSFGETTHSGIFAAGDVVLGAKTVVQATAYAKKVADAMDKYMRGELADASQAE